MSRCVRFHGQERKTSDSKKEVALSTQYVNGRGTWRKEKAFLDEATSQFADRNKEEDNYFSNARACHFVRDGQGRKGGGWIGEIHSPLGASGIHVSTGL